MDASKLGLGHIISTEQNKDAVHMAIAPVMAHERLCPGDHVGLNQAGEATEGAPHIGVIDPFLKCKSVAAGERCWLFLYPGTITGLRHEWTHPAFVLQAVPNMSESEKFLADVASECGVSYDRMMDAIREDDYISMGENESYKDVLEGIYDEFCRHASIVVGKEVRPYPFSCSC